MASDILIMDCVATNRIVLKVKLLAAQYRVRPCATLGEALEEIEVSKPDLVILDTCTDTEAVLDAFRTLKATPETALIPVIATGGFTTPRDRVLALEAGADDVLTRPFDDHILQARLRSLLRARDARLELQLRDGTRSALGFAEAAGSYVAPARLVVASTHAGVADGTEALRPKLANTRVTHLSCDQLASDLRTAAQADVVVLDLRQGPFDDTAFYRLLSDLRSQSGTRHAAILTLLPPDAQQAAAMALDLGANNVVTAQVHRDEIAHRCAVLLKSKRDADALRRTVETGLEAAIIDPLTSVYNRRYALPHLLRLSQESEASGRQFAVMVLDLDHFKAVNDQYGHAVGDEVLQQVAGRLKDNLRAVDLLARIGGEEFLVAIPHSDAAHARRTAERLCALIGEAPFFVGPDRQELRITMSVGVSLNSGDDATQVFGSVDEVMSAADGALYAAKSGGRNMVSLGAA
ncbi:diguanylate cyclase [Thalassorhabdomicrobium marinisediminis]|uniref:diguanylate cyclase n=1 Tax=Thalassorhabdomicrobium marinisediminis TaxID=2170577 RepID=UPI00248FCD0B|nr:diguanylate cyclase [Thalassorhabdomicrobium marinisediminis]